MTTEHNPKSCGLSLLHQQGKGQVKDRTDEKADVGQSKEEVARSLAVLRAVIECTADGILVTDENGKVLCYNQLYVDMWAIPRALIESEKHTLLMQYCSNHLKDPRQYQLLTGEIYARWPPESFDLLQFNNGQVFERYTKIKVIEGQSVGRVWSFRDITQRRRAEAYTAQL